jgi:hypothetical protein
MKYAPGLGLLLATLFTGCSSTPISTASRTMDAAADVAVPADALPVVAAPEAGASDVQPALPGDASPEDPPAVCLEAPAAQPGARSPVTVAVDLTYAGKPVPYAEPFALPGGGTLTLSNFRFFLSDVTLLPEGAAPVAVDILAADGKPAAFNVHLVNAEDPSQMSFRIAAPPGDYTGVSFVFGLNGECNARRPGNVAPLDTESQLSWPSPFGFLFLRYEGLLAGAGTDRAFSALAMGGIVGAYGAPRVEAEGALRVTSAPGAAHLHVALDEIFRAAALPADLTDKLIPLPSAAGSVEPGGAEIELGEHLRQNATKVPIFSVTSGS